MRACLFLLLGCAGCDSATGQPEPLPLGGRHVLFVGNSLTYSNDLPATLAAIGTLAGDTIQVRMAVGPGLALIDHLNGGSDAVGQLRGKSWDYVVLQQGPTPQGICRDSLILWTTMFDPEIKAAGAKTAVLMTWPALNRRSDFEQVRISFEEAAHAVDGIFIPAGDAWRALLDADRGAALYGSDGFHPSPTGTFLTALVIYERLSGRDPRTLPPRAFANGTTLSLPEATIRLLQTAAHEANGRFPQSSSGSPRRLPSPSGTAPTC